MPATPAQIAFALLQGRSVVWTDAFNKDAFGNAARDTGKEPVMTYFDDIGHALVMANRRGAIVGNDARRFVASISGIEEADFSTELPATRVIDDEKLADMNCAAVSAAYDHESDETELMLWGTIG